MKLTNKHNLPDSIKDFLELQFYDSEKAKGTLTVTSILKPIQETILVERYFDQIEVDVSELIWLVFGSAVHYALEKVEGDLPVERLFFDVFGERISGKFDIIRGNILKDYKVTSVFASGRDTEHTWQLSLYRWLIYHSMGKTLKDDGEIIYFYRDWRKSEKFKYHDYPQFPMETKTYKLRSFDHCEALVQAQVLLIKASRKTTDDELVPCSDKERWKSTSGKYIRCESYCLARQFCKQNNK